MNKPPVPEEDCKPAFCRTGSENPCHFRRAGQFQDRSGLIGEVEVWRCSQCGLGVSRPPLPDPSLLYTDRTSADFQPRMGAAEYSIKSYVFRRAARRLLADLPEDPAVIVDVGCGSGLFTRCMADECKSGHVVGMDFHAMPPSFLDASQYLPFERASDLSGGADVVLAFHVLEHDDDPLGLLDRITALLRPGGRLVIEVPNIDCLWAGVFGPYWDAWYLPYHRSHFSGRSLRTLLQAGGLIIEDENDICLPTMGRTMSNLFGRRAPALFFLLGILLHPAQWIGEKISRRPSALRVIARKP